MLDNGWLYMVISGKECIMIKEKKPRNDRKGKLRHCNFLMEFSDYAELEKLALLDDRTVGYCVRSAIRDYLATAKK